MNKKIDLFYCMGTKNGGLIQSTQNSYNRSILSQLY